MRAGDPQEEVGKWKAEYPPSPPSALRGFRGWSRGRGASLKNLQL